jgi:hypothetical protein
LVILTTLAVVFAIWVLMWGEKQVFARGEIRRMKALGKPVTVAEYISCNVTPRTQNAAPLLKQAYAVYERVTLANPVESKGLGSPDWRAQQAAVICHSETLGAIRHALQLPHCQFYTGTVPLYEWKEPVFVQVGVLVTLLEAHAKVEAHLGHAKAASKAIEDLVGLAHLEMQSFSLVASGVRNLVRALEGLRYVDERVRLHEADRASIVARLRRIDLQKAAQDTYLSMWLWARESYDLYKERDAVLAMSIARTCYEALKREPQEAQDIIARCDDEVARRGILVRGGSVSYAQFFEAMKLRDLVVSRGGVFPGHNTPIAPPPP